MLTDVYTIAFQGVCTVNVAVQVHMAKGIPAFNIVGLPNKTVAESKERIRAAILSLSLFLPPRRITVNLSPADLFKEGSHYDLPIAVGLLACMGVIQETSKLSSYLLLGELSLDGRIVFVSGILAAAISAYKQNKGIVCPYENGQEAAFVDNIDALHPKNLLSLINHFNGTEKIVPQKRCATVDFTDHHPDMADVIGQPIAKRAVEIAAAGRHNLLMIGPPGTGKSMLAKRLPGILPNLSNEEIIEINVISSIARRIDGLVKSRPFREPHSSSSLASIIGGGRSALPGEITLAHNGVLFLDELPEFSRSILEALRQPLEDKRVLISRVMAHIIYPADFQLVAAMNPCRCGYFNDVRRACTRIPKCAADYQNKISGPIMSRIDIKVEVGNVNIFSKNVQHNSASSASIKSRVMLAREMQEKRYGKSMCNASLSGKEIERLLVLNRQAQATIRNAVEADYLSVRDYTKVLKVARSIADLSQQDEIQEEHVAEAMSYSERVLSKYRA